MPIAMAVAGGASLVSNLVGGFSGKKSAKKDRRAAMDLQRQALGLQKEQLGFARDRYDEAKGMYGGIEQQVLQSAQEGVKADEAGVTSRAVGDVAGQYAGQTQAMARKLGRYGVRPGSARFEETLRDIGLRQAADTATLVNNAREAERKRADDQTWARRWDVSSRGVNQMQTAMNNMQGQAGNVSNDLNSMAAAHSASANQAASDSRAAFGQAGEALGGLIGSFKKAPSAQPLIENVERPRM